MVLSSVLSRSIAAAKEPPTGRELIKPSLRCLPSRARAKSKRASTSERSRRRRALRTRASGTSTPRRAGSHRTRANDADRVARRRRSRPRASSAPRRGASENGTRDCLRHFESSNSPRATDAMAADATSDEPVTNEPKGAPLLLARAPASAPRVDATAASLRARDRRPDADAPSVPSPSLLRASRVDRQAPSLPSRISRRGDRSSRRNGCVSPLDASPRPARERARDAVPRAVNPARLSTRPSVPRNVFLW